MVREMLAAAVLAATVTGANQSPAAAEDICVEVAAGATALNVYVPPQRPCTHSGYETYWVGVDETVAGVRVRLMVRSP